MDFSNTVCFKCGLQGHTSNWPGCPVNSHNDYVTRSNVFFGNANEVQDKQVRSKIIIKLL